MKLMFLDYYIMISILIAAVDVLLAVKSMQKNKTIGRFLGFACLSAAVVDISYLISILSGDYFCMSVMSSVYFVNIDIMLVCLLIFTIYFTKGRFTALGKWFIGLCALYAVLEIVVFAINPFYEIAVHYVRRDTIIAKFGYEMRPLYWMHLIFTYALVVVVLVLLIRKMCRIPREYRSQYRFVILGILAIVMVNAVFLFWPGEKVYNLLDYSICGYSLTAFRSDVELKLLAGTGKVMLLMIDVDRFKAYNDTFGHHDGDQLLILIAQTLLGALREEDCACRMGGDEFAAMLCFDQAAQQAQLQERAQQIFDKVNMTLKAADQGTGISMGMAIASPEMTFNQMYELADKALYRAKESGRGRLVRL